MTERAAWLAKSAVSTDRMNDYDVIHYDIDITVLRDQFPFNGSVKMTFESLVDEFGVVDFNFGEDGTIERILFDGQEIQYTRTGDVVSAVLPAPMSMGETGVLHTFYRHPIGGSAFLNSAVTNRKTGQSTVILATQSEPYKARTWWPCKDFPSDKADSVDIRLTVDDEMIPVSNGVKMSDIDNGDGSHTVHWKTSYPIVTYLVSAAISEYNVNEYTWNYGDISMPVTSWYVRPTEGTIQENDGVMMDALTVFSDLFGTYPFHKEKYGMAEYTWGGAMEHQTVSSMGAYFRDIVTHELAHQWFGDKVTCNTFEHIWLNEGWATYSEALYNEMTLGVDWRNQMMNQAAYYGPGTIFVDEPQGAGFSRIFSGSLSYNKASWILHMLRGVVGDSAFFRAARAYLGDESRENYRSVITGEFQQFYEAESGLDLTNFFQQWIYGEYYPTYGYRWTSAESGGKYDITLEIEQRYVPDRQLFDMPIQVTFGFPGGSDTIVTVQNAQQFEQYSFTFDADPNSVRLDEANWILDRQQLIPSGPLTNPDFANTVLLVNGVDWETPSYTAELTRAYRDSIFTPGRGYVYYDIFPYPSAGYPAQLPDPVGSVELSLEDLERFCTVVWVGNAYNGDELIWQNSPMLDYVKGGGNLVLLTREGLNFIDEEMREWLGIRWTGDGLSTIESAAPQMPGLTPLGFTGFQNRVATFEPTFNSPHSELLYSDTTFNEPQAIGVWGKPRDYMGSQSGHFVFLSMRPYRVDGDDLRLNLDALMDEFTCEPLVNVPQPKAASSMQLAQNYPNPVSLAASGGTRIAFTLSGSAQAFTSVKVYDQLGRLVAEPVATDLAPGHHSVVFNANDLPAGVYTYRLTSGTESISRQMIITK